MEESILVTIAKLAGIEDDLEAFRVDLIVYINGVFSKLCHHGVGPPTGFEITDESQCWDDYLADEKYLTLKGFVKTYMSTKVRLTFDPPASGVMVKSLESTRDDAEYGIICEVDKLKAQERVEVNDNV